MNGRWKAYDSFASVVPVVIAIVDVYCWWHDNDSDSLRGRGLSIIVVAVFAVNGGPW